MSRNLIARIAVAVVAGPIIIWIGYRGGWWLFGMLLLFALIGIIEYVSNEGWHPNSFTFWAALVAVAAVFSAITAYPVPLVSDLVALAGGSWAAALILVVAFVLLSSMLFAVGSKPPADLLKCNIRLTWGVLYLGLTYPVVFLLGNGSTGFHGGDALLFLFGLLWLGDTAAMGVGSAVGRHKLAPTVSPNKTVEGLFGGILGAVVIGVVMFFWKFHELGFVNTMIVAVGCSLFGQLGDLVESMWKRSLGIKDSSAVIPGHGGVLDRFDSLLFGAPFMYAYFSLLR